MTATVDWLIELRPDCKDAEGGGWLDILSDLSTETDAIEALDDWAATLQAFGFIPDSGDFRSRSPIAVVRRSGRRSFRVRADCWEHETDGGYCNGYGYLRAVSRPRSMSIPEGE